MRLTSNNSDPGSDPSPLQHETQGVQQQEGRDVWWLQLSVHKPAVTRIALTMFINCEYAVVVKPGR